MSFENSLKTYIAEAFRYRRIIAVTFVVVYTLALLAGLTWPKGYTVSTTILVDEKSIIQPLMQGAAVPTEAVDRARLAREIIYGRKIMAQLVTDGEGGNTLSPEALEREINGLMGETTITNVGRNLIRIEYSNEHPEIAYARAKRLAELYIEESTAAKAADATLAPPAPSAARTAATAPMASMAAARRIARRRSATLRAVGRITRIGRGSASRLG